MLRKGNQFLVGGLWCVTPLINSPGRLPVIQWMSDQPKVFTGDCVTTTIEKVAKLAQCDQKKYMYCQRHLVLPTVQEG
jgi:hypothetical protein